MATTGEDLIVTTNDPIGRQSPPATRPSTTAYSAADAPLAPYEPGYTPGPYDYANGGYIDQYDPPVQPRIDAYAAEQYETGGAPAPQGRPTHRRSAFDPGVDLGRFVGGAVITAVIAAMVGYLGVLIVNVATSRWVPGNYWIDHQLVRPELSPSTAAWLAAAAAIVAAGAMVGLLQITNSAGMFFTLIAALLAILGFVIAITSGPWPATVGQAGLIAVVIGVVGVLTTSYTRMTITTPERF